MYEQIGTNRDRTTCFGQKKDDLRMRTVGATDGTTITGFYGHFVSLHTRTKDWINDADIG